MRNGHLSSLLAMGLVSALLAFGQALAQEDSVPDKPTLIVRITPPAPYLQEEIVQVIRVIAPHPFEELVLDLPPVDGAEMITLQQPRNRKFQTYGGEGYIYETRRAIFPRQSGALRIPPVRVSGTVSVSRNEKEPFALRRDAMIMDIRPPVETFSENWWLVAHKVNIDESWSKPLETLRVGDRVTRSIEVTVTGATGAHLPELEQGRSSGLTVLPGRTERITDITPDGVVGKISRTFDIRVDIDQPINISPVRVVWWNTTKEIERRSAAPAVRLEPLPRDVEALVSNAMLEAAAAHQNSRQGILVMAMGSVALAIASAFWLLRSRHRINAKDRALRKALFDESEPIHVVRALKVWAEAMFPSERPMTLEKLGQRLGPDARQRLSMLQEAAFGKLVKGLDTRGLALDIVGIARERRRQASADIRAALIGRLLGPEKRLPGVDARPSRARRSASLFGDGLEGVT